MLRRSLFALTTWLLLSGAPSAGAAPRPDCTHGEVQRARAAASQAMARREYDGALKTLRALEERCWLRTGEIRTEGEPAEATLDYFWFHSDLSVALLRAGKVVECLRVLAPLTTPRPPVSLRMFGLEDERVGHAIQYNEGQCQAAHERRFTGFSAPACPQAAGVPGVAVPAALQPGGTMCIVLDPPPREARRDDDEPDPDQVCARPRLLSRPAPGRPPRRSPLRATEGPLREVGECCNVETLSIGALQGKTVLRVQGGGRNCQGGTAAGSLDALYQWSGDALRLLEDNSVYEH